MRPAPMPCRQAARRSASRFGPLSSGASSNAAVVWRREPDGTISSVAGSNSASLFGPMEVTTDSLGDIRFTQAYEYGIVEVNPAGISTTVGSLQFPPSQGFPGGIRPGHRLGGKHICGKLRSGSDTNNVREDPGKVDVGLRVGSRGCRSWSTKYIDYRVRVCICFDLVDGGPVATRTPDLYRVKVGVRTGCGKTGRPRRLRTSSDLRFLLNRDGSIRKVNCR